MLFIKHVLRVPLRMTDEQLLVGDDMIHGEAAYVLGPCEAHGHLLRGQDPQTPPSQEPEPASRERSDGSNDIKQD